MLEIVKVTYRLRMSQLEVPSRKHLQIDTHHLRYILVLKMLKNDLKFANKIIW